MASKEKNLEELMAQAQALLNERRPRKKKKVEFQFHRDSVTGQRTSKYKYRPRVKSATDRPTLQSQSDLEDHEVFCEDTTDDQQQDDRSLHSLLTKCQDVLDSFHSVPDINWEKRMASLNENWEASRPLIFKAILQLEGCGMPLNAHHCELCNHVPWQIRCIECGGKRMCSECDASIHQYLPFHDREALLDGSVRSIPPTFTVNNAGLLEQTRKHLLYDLMPKICPHCHQEGTFVVCASPGFIIVVNQKGRFDFHNYHMSCSSCGYKVDPCSLDRMIAAGYWPGSPKDSSYFFDQNLFRQWDFLQKRLPGTSEVSFLRALGDFSQSKGRAPTITANTFSRSFKEWKFCMHEVEVSQGLSWMVCPACALKQHSCHVDGNAKLYRYKSSGTQKRPCYYGETFIADKADVDRHIKDVYSKVPRSKNANDSMCGNSHWRAAGNRARKKNKLDETGLEIAGCRHGLAQWAVNMYQGEIYGYAHYLQCKKMLPAGVNFFWEDVVCKYWKWAAKVGGAATTVMKPALSVMHAKGHKWSCQVLWGGRWQDGSASTTGEEVEQINAHVSRCTNTTKYMLPEGRNEALTEQIFGWNRRKILAMVTSLVKRYTRAAKMCDSSNKDIDAVLTEFNIDRKAFKLNEWKAQVLKVAKEEQQTANSRGELSELNQLKHQMEMLCFSIAQSTMAITKLADSSKQRTRLRRNIDSNKKQLQSMIEKFNALPANAGKTQVSLASLLAGGELPDDVAQSSDIPIRVKSKVVDAFQIHSRWLEEVNLLKEEMFNFLKFYAEIRIPALREEIVKIEDEIKAQAEFEEQEREPRTVSSLKASGSSADTAMGTVKYACLDKHRLVHLGKVALLRKGLFFCQDQLNRGFNSFQKILCENGGNLNEYIVADKDASVTVEDSGVEIDRNGGDEDDDHDVDNDDDDNDGDDDEDTNSDDDNESPLLFSTCNLEINVPMRPCLSESGVCIWDFPRELSQSTFQGRNGSNACSIIALLLAQGIHKTNCDLFPSPFLPGDWVALVCGCIKAGNAMYDRSRGSLPHRYLSAGEAAMIAGDVLDVSVGQPKPVRVNDPHVPSTLRFHLLQLCNSSVTSYAVLIVNEKTVLFVSFPGETLVLIDSHLHGQTGAMVVLGNLCKLDDFVCVVGDSVGFNSQTFGNLVQLSF